MTVTELRKALESLEKKGYGNETVYNLEWVPDYNGAKGFRVVDIEVNSMNCVFLRTKQLRPRR